MFLPLRNLLGHSIKRAKIEPQVEATQVMAVFDSISRQIWGQAISEHIKPLYIINRCLSVAVLSNIYAQEIRLREREIIAEINAKMKKEVVTRIRCLL